MSKFVVSKVVRVRRKVGAFENDVPCRETIGPGRLHIQVCEVREIDYWVAELQCGHRVIEGVHVKSVDGKKRLRCPYCTGGDAQAAAVRKYAQLFYGIKPAKRPQK